MKVLYVTNIPAPYKVDFFNGLGEKVDLTVVFEATGASDQGINFNYNLETIKSFKAVFLREGNIKEKSVNRKIIRYLDADFDEIVIGAYSYFTEMFALLWLKAKKKPYFLSTDGGLIKENENPIKKWYKTFLISGAKGYFSPSKTSDEYLIYYGARKERIHRYPFTSYGESKRLQCVVSSEEKSALRMKLGIEESVLVLGVGQFIYRKGWDILLKAMVNVPENTALCIVGGKNTEEYDNIIKENGLKHTYFKEFMGSEKLAEYYKVADLFVLPTREDIWGLVVNEAMNFGLPVITTASCVAGLELVQEGKNGYLIEDIDSANGCRELSQKITELVMNKSMREKMAQASLDKAKEYSIEKMAESYYLIINDSEIVDEKRDVSL